MPKNLFSSVKMESEDIYQFSLDYGSDLYETNVRY